MASTEFNFTIKAIEALPIPTSGKRAYYRDSKVHGLELMITSTGTRSFNFYRKISGRPVRAKLGAFPDLSIEKARGKASAMNADIADGKNPAEARQRLRKEQTFGELFREYMERYSKKQKRSWQYDEREINKFLSHWFNHKISAVSKQDVQKLHERIRDQNGLYQANRLLERLRAMYNKAIEWGWKGENPAAGIKKFKEKSRDRFLQPHELPYFFEALETETENVAAKDYIMLSLLTGARKSNVLSMRWDELNLERAEWRIPETKNGEPVLVALSVQALEILTMRKKHKQNEWVFASKTSKKGHLQDPKKAWQRVLKRAEIYQLLELLAKKKGWKVKDLERLKLEAEAHLTNTVEEYRKEAKRLKLDTSGLGLPGVRIHDLRRSLGSWQAVTGASGYIIGKSLGHKSQQATAIYARLNLDPVRESVERATAAMFAAAGKK